MTSLGNWGGVALAIAVGVGCGGASFSAASNDGDASSPETGGGTSGGGASSGGDSSTADAPSSSGATSTDGSPGSSGAGTADGSATSDGPTFDSADAATGVTDGPLPACPNVAGSYSIALTQATGCSGIGVTASQCIRNNGGCSFEFRSNAASGGNPGIDGSFTLDSSGTFDGATLTEGAGTQARTGCTGSWSAATMTMTVDCGGTGTTQSCVVTLARTSTGSGACN